MSGWERRARIAVALAGGVLACAVGCSLGFDPAEYVSGNGAPPGDGGSDASSQVDGGGPTPSVPFCKQPDASTAAFCDDFDERPLGFDWLPPEMSVGATRALDTTAASPPHSILFTVPASGPTTNAGAWQGKVFADVAGLECTYDVEPLAGRDATRAGLGVIIGGNTDGNLYAYVGVPPTFDGAELVQVFRPTGGGGVVSKRKSLGRWPIKGSFMRVSLRLRLDGASSVVRVFIDGEEAGADTVAQSLSRANSACGIGIPAIEGNDAGTGGWSARFDNFAAYTTKN